MIMNAGALLAGAIDQPGRDQRRQAADDPEADVVAERHRRAAHRRRRRLHHGGGLHLKTAATSLQKTAQTELHQSMISVLNHAASATSSVYNSQKTDVLKNAESLRALKTTVDSLPFFR
jgi:hypothetical protein